MNHQSQVSHWIQEVIGEDAFNNQKERAFRFLEEALELAQACGVTPAEVDALRDYTFGRPVGDIHQEIAGSMFTLMALAQTHGFDALRELEIELARVSCPQIKTRIRNKALAAPEGPLPQ